MSNVWIGEGVLKLKEEYLDYGEEIPKDALSDERLNQLKELGLIGKPKEFEKAEAEKKVKKNKSKKSDKESDETGE